MKHSLIFLPLAFLASLLGCRHEIFAPDKNPCFEQQIYPNVNTSHLVGDFDVLFPEYHFFDPNLDENDPNILVVGLTHYNEDIGAPSLRNEIWRFNLTTMQGTKVKDCNPWSLRDIRLSRQGWIAYTSGGLNVVRTDGSGHQVFASGDPGYWNPAGDTLSFISQRINYVDVWSKAVYDGTKWVVADTNGAAPPWYPRKNTPLRFFSPDESLWAEYVQNNPEQVGFTWHIYRTGGELVAQVPIDDAYPTGAFFSPDNRYMFFTTRIDYPAALLSRYDIVQKTVTNVRKAVNGNYSGRMFVSADSKKVILERFWWDTLVGSTVMIDAGIWQMDLNGCNETRLLLDVHQ